jgi:SAM-dependent methyltransferase
LGESFDEERNQESRCKEEGRSEEKEVAIRRPAEDVIPSTKAPATGPFFICASLVKSVMQTTGTAYTLADQALMAEAKNYFAWQSRLVLREAGRRVVEVGCGTGNFTQHLSGRDLVVAVDHEPQCLERLRSRLGNRKNLETLVTAVSSPEFAELRRYAPDSCVCLNVLEHIEDDVEALGAMASILPAGGVVVLMVPAFATLYGPIDRNLGHYRRYSRRSVALLAEAAGLRIRKAHYMNSAGWLGWWLNARVLRREKQSAAQIRFFDRYVVPLMAWVEEKIRPPFGQSLFVVLERTDRRSAPNA